MEVSVVLLRDLLLTMPSENLADIYDVLYEPTEPGSLSVAQYRRAIADYWEDAAHWDELVNALSVTERQALVRLALGEKCRIDVFVEELSGLGIVALERERNRIVVPDDVRVWLLERLPSLEERLSAREEQDEDGATPV
jgi:hypothetical protein